MWHHSWMLGHHWIWMWGMPFGGFWFLIFLAVLFAVLLIRSPHRRYPSRTAALELLEQRYARGEIGRDEYLEKRRDLLG